MYFVFSLLFEKFALTYNWVHQEGNSDNSQLEEFAWDVSNACLLTGLLGTSHTFVFSWNSCMLAAQALILSHLLPFSLSSLSPNHSTIEQNSPKKIKTWFENRKPYLSYQWRMKMNVSLWNCVLFLLYKTTSMYGSNQIYNDVVLWF